MTQEKAVTKDSLLAKLQRGASNGQHVAALATMLDTTPRAIRNLVSELRESGHPVCAHPKTGYYIAATQEELDATCKFLHERAMHSLKLYGQLKRAVIYSMQDDFTQDDEGAFAL